MKLLRQSLKRTVVGGFLFEKPFDRQRLLAAIDLQLRMSAGNK